MSIRPRVAAALCVFLTGSVLLAGCGDAETTGTGAASAASSEEPSRGAAVESTAAGVAVDATDPLPDFPADTEPDTADATADARVTVRDIRIGAHDGFDRVVFELGGTGVPGWDVQYVDAASSQGSGDPVEVAGGSVLQVTLTGAGYPYETGVEEYARGPLTSASASVVAEVVWDATFEGTSVAFIGTSAQRPFRVYALADSTRVVVDIAHAAG